MSYYLQKECQVNWLKAEFNLVTSTLEASFYPHLFWSPQSQCKFSVFNKLNTRLNDLIFIGQDATHMV